MKKLLTLLILSFITVFNQLNAQETDFIYLALRFPSDVVKLDASNGNEVWRFTNHTDDVNNVAVDQNGFVYSASEDGTVRKINSSGTQVWSFTGHSSDVFDVAVDQNGFVYSASNDGTVRKISPTGNQVWSFTNHSSTVLGLTVDLNGNVYSGDSSGTLYKIDSNGNEVWAYNYGGFVLNVEVDYLGNIYINGGFPEDVEKISPNGNLIWSFDESNGLSPFRDLAVDQNQNVYVKDSSRRFHKLDSNGNEIFQINLGGVGGQGSIAVDLDLNIYVGADGGNLHKYDSNGNSVWTTSQTYNVYNIKVNQPLPHEVQEPPEYNVELQTNTAYNDFIYQDDEVNVTTDSVITTILNDESFTVTSTAQSTGSYTFNYWYDLDDMSIFTTDRNFTIEDPNRNYNLIADYTLDSFNTFNIDSNLPNPQNFTLNTTTLEGQSLTINQNEFNNYQHPDDRDWEIIAPTNNIGFYEFDYYYDNDANDIYDFNNVITGSGFSPPNLTAVYSLPEEYQINLIIESGIGDIIFQHGENDPISGPFISQTIGLGDDWTATAPNNEDYQFNNWFDLNEINIFSNNQTITINDTDKDYYLEATYTPLVDINWDSNGGTQIPQQTVIIESSIEPPDEPTRPGFVFDYWEDNNQNEVIFPKNIQQDVTFTAVWIETYTLTYDTNGGGQINPDIYLENEVPEVVTPSRFGYEFDGWYTDDNTFQNEYDFTDPITVDTTIHAKWQFGSDRDASLSLTTFLDNNDLGDGFSQIIIMTALYIFINVMIYVYSGPLVVTLILNFILSSIFLILGWIPMWIIIVIFIGLFGFIYLSSSGRGAME